ncbi:MAG TPA: transglycosylase SLT domain-containing protein [Methylophilaceae bacterium]|jgi:soluble lytic murein transglycosylase-like protein
MHKSLIYPSMLLVSLVSPVALAFADDDNEPPMVHSLLERASVFERSANEREGEWHAAGLYCEASRLGSSEAEYRLGMLYAFGKGVPKDRALAASLFSVAASQGHREAQKMLDTINFTTTQLPECVLAAVLPEKGSAYGSAEGDDSVGIESHIDNLPASKRWMVDLVSTLAEWYDVDPRLILSIVAVESDFKTRAQSPKSAMGLMQLIPATAERFNVRNAYDATQNIKGGIAYMRWLLSYFRGDVKLAVAGYNAGEKAVDRYKGVPPYAETRQYVKRVLMLYQRSNHPYDEKITDPSPLVANKG